MDHLSQNCSVCSPVVDGVVYYRRTNVPRSLVACRFLTGCGARPVVSTIVSTIEEVQSQTINTVSPKRSSSKIQSDQISSLDHAMMSKKEISEEEISAKRVSWQTNAIPILRYLILRPAVPSVLFSLCILL